MSGSDATFRIREKPGATPEKQPVLARQRQNWLLELTAEHRLGRKRILDTALAATLEAAAAFGFLSPIDLTRQYAYDGSTGGPMRLDPATLEELSAFYARRLPEGAADVARATGLPTPGSTGVQAWRDLLVSAEGVGRTYSVGKTVSGLLPGDENAREAARSLAPAGGSRWMVGVGAAVGIAAAVALAMVVGTAAVMSSGTAQADVKAAAPAAPAAAPASPVVSLPNTPVLDSPAAETDAVAATSAPRSPARSTAAAVAPAGLASACRGAGTIGWWYAGTSAPGAAGETITMKRGATVRSAAPTAEHDWRMEPAVRCGLKAGDVITLGEVRPMPGGRFWVELPG